MDHSRQRHRSTRSSYRPKERSPPSQPRYSNPKSPRQEARRGEEDDFRNRNQPVRRSRDYNNRNRNSTRRSDPVPPTIDSSLGCEVDLNNHAPPRSRSRSSYSRRPQHSNSTSNTSVPLRRRNLSPASTTITDIQRRHSASRRSYSRANSKEHYYQQDFGNSDGKVVYKHGSVKNSGPYDEKNHYSRSRSTEPKRRPNIAPTAAEHVDRLIAEAEALLHRNNSSHHEEDNSRHRRSSVKSPLSTKSKKKREDVASRNEYNIVEKITSQISRVKERARSRSGSIDGRMKHSSSASTVTTKSNSSSGGESSNASESKTTPPPPPPLTRRSNSQLFPCKSASPSAHKVSVENIDDEMADTQPVLPMVIPANNQEGLPNSRKMASFHTGKKKVLPPPPAHSKKGSKGYPDLSSSSLGMASSRVGKFPLPPLLTHAKMGRSFNDLSSPNNSILLPSLKSKSHPPPPPPPRRNMNNKGTLQNNHHTRMFNSSSMALSNVNSTVPTSLDIVPVTAISTTPSISNATNQPQLQKSHGSRNNKNHPVKSMGYTDPYGDSGLYSGEVDDESRPHGRGKMKYENGVFYEGNWNHGLKDETQGDSSGDQLTNVTRERMLSGFTSWKGQKKKDGTGKDISDSGMFVYGMEWVDLAGMSGKYTGQVNANDEPDGNGVMRYEFGLIAEGKWIKGKLIDGSGGGMSSGIVAQSIAGGMSVAPGGMSVAGGAASVVSGLGMMSIGGNVAGMMMGSYPNGMMNPIAPQFAMSNSPAGTMVRYAPANIIYQQRHGIIYPQAVVSGGDTTLQ